MSAGAGVTRRASLTGSLLPCCSLPPLPPAPAPQRALRAAAGGRAAGAGGQPGGPPWRRAPAQRAAAQPALGHPGRRRAGGERGPGRGGGGALPPAQARCADVCCTCVWCTEQGSPSSCTALRLLRGATLACGARCRRTGRPSDPLPAPPPSCCRRRPRLCLPELHAPAAAARLHGGVVCVCGGQPAGAGPPV